MRFVPEKAETLQLQTGEARLMKTDILKGLMFYTVKGSGTFYPISLENVKMVLEMNANGKKPADISDLAEVEEKTEEESIEFADVVGQITLASLDKRKPQHKNKKQGPPRSNPNQQNKQQTSESNPANNKEQGQPKSQNRNKNRKPRPNNNGPSNNNQPNKNNPPKE